jgi:hypothetical protein
MAVKIRLSRSKDGGREKEADSEAGSREKRNPADTPRGEERIRRVLAEGLGKQILT